MTTGTLLTLTCLPVLVAGIALGASAQNQAPPIEQPVAAKDKVVVESAFAKADANGDGKLSRDEAARLPGIGARFDEFDKNKDGVLTLDEFAGMFVTTN